MNVYYRHHSKPKNSDKRIWGLFVKSLNEAPASFHVERQAYYDGSFIENHAHSMSFEGELIAIGIKI